MTQTPQVVPPMKKGGGEWGEVMAYPLACVGAMVGVAVGAMVTRLALQANLYAIIVLGVLAGYGASLLARRRNAVMGAIAAFITLAGGLLTEAWLFPMWIDGVPQDFDYFINHLSSMNGFHVLVNLIGAVCAFYIAWRK